MRPVPFQQNTLQHFSYHWFWGIRYHAQVQYPNLTSHLHAWSQNQTLIENMQKKLAKINQKFWLIRWIYWLFNIQHYAELFYKLAAFYISKSEQNTMKNSMFEHLKQTAYHAAQCVRSIFQAPPQAITDTSPDEPSLPKSVLVSHRMVPHLQILELDISIGQPITLDMIKKAYYKKAQKTHPDTNPSIPRDVFQQVKNAKETLDTMLTRALAGISTYTEAELDQSVANSIQILRETRQAVIEMNEQLSGMNEQLSGMREQLTHAVEGTEKIITMIRDHQCQQGHELSSAPDSPHQGITPLDTTHAKKTDAKVRAKACCAVM